MHRQTFALAIPMILSNLTVPITGLVDTAVVGHLDHAHFLGATAIGSLIITMIMWAMGFLRMSTTGLTAQANGSSDGYAIRQSLFNAVLLALAISLIVLVLRGTIWQLAMAFMGASDAVYRFATEYFDIRIWAMPALLLRYVFIGWLLGMQNAKVPLFILFISNLVNIGLDILFVVYWDMGVAGAAWASLIADYSGLVIGALAVYWVLKNIPREKESRPLFESSAFKRLLGLNRDIFIRTLALESVFYIQTSVGASLGDNILAANAVLMNFVMIMAHGLDGFANAVEALAGKAFGKKYHKEFWDALVTSGFWSLICSGFFVLLYWLIGEWMVRFMTDIPEVRNAAFVYLPYLVFVPLIAVWSYWLDGIFVGITRTSEMRNSMLIAVIFVFIPAMFSVKLFGNHGLWLAFYCFMLMRASGLVYYLIKLERKQLLC
ncbi:MATE family efflux transporter [Pleionea sediminis]|uniref:MATE family efflux transporter n=1 Tax=Pleionea sediminis TaxID=2569479 RepID=UPI0011851E9C|nr:MATE family efflux transporter [Pleionea sediminis]